MHSSPLLACLFFTEAPWYRCYGHLYWVFFIFVFVFVVLGPHLWHMEVPRLGSNAGQQHSHSHTDPSHIHNLCRNLWQCQILNPSSEAGNRTHIFKDTSQVLNLLSHNGTLFLSFFFNNKHVFIYLFRATPAVYGSSRSCSCQLTPQPQQHQIQALSMTYAPACSNAGSLTH